MAGLKKGSHVERLLHEEADDGRIAGERSISKIIPHVEASQTSMR